MYKKILNSIFQGTADQACERILDVYNQKGFCVVDYLYFANIVGKKMFSHYHVSYPLEIFGEALLSDYKAMSVSTVYAAYQDAILDADLVLMDGIALQLFCFLAKKIWLDNLNGTDFCPYFLAYIAEKYPEKKINILLYGTYPHLLERTKVFLMKQGYTVVYAQDGYSNLDWEKVEYALKGKEHDIQILLNARSTPDYPIQELWTFSNKAKVKKHGLIVMNQGGTFDFWVGAQKRAPKLVRKVRLERLWRLLLTPQRQIKKTLDSLAIFKYVFVYLILKKY